MRTILWVTSLTMMFGNLTIKPAVAQEGCSVPGVVGLSPASFAGLGLLIVMLGWWALRQQNRGGAATVVVVAFAAILQFSPFATRAAEAQAVECCPVQLHLESIQVSDDTDVLTTDEWFIRTSGRAGPSALSDVGVVTTGPVSADPGPAVTVNASIWSGYVATAANGTWGPPNLQIFVTEDDPLLDDAQRFHTLGAGTVENGLSGNLCDESEVTHTSITSTGGGTALSADFSVVVRYRWNVLAI